MATTNSSAAKKSAESKKIADLQKKIEELTAMMESIASLKADTQKVEPLVLKTEKQSIDPYRRVKVTSLTYGVLTLHCQAHGYLRFKEYGETQTLPYIQLADYVNACKSAATSGKFYIQDPEAVEELLLTEPYKKIASDTIINDILNGRIADFEDIVTNMTEGQKESIVSLVIDKVYGGRLKDYNLINKLSELTGVDIMKKVDEAKSVAEANENKD